MKGGFLSFITFFIGAQAILAQPSVQFSLPEKACKDETFTPTNTSDLNLQYNWEFCYGGLLQAPAFQNSITINNATGPDGLAIVEDNGNWYGFVVGTNSNNLIRLDFGGSLANNPTEVNLGNPSTSLQRPRDIDLIKHNGIWFAFITNFDPISSEAKVVRFDFGASIASNPSATDMGNFSGRLSQPVPIQLRVDKGNLIALIGDRAQRKLLLVNFGANPTVPPTLSTSYLEIFFPATGFFRDFDVLKFGSDWYGLTVSESGAVQKMKFTNTLFSIPQVAIITDQLPAITSPSNIVFLRDIDKFVALVTEYGGNLIRLDFGRSPNTYIPVFQNLGNGGLLANNQGIAFSKQGAAWIGYTHNTGLSRLNRITFQGDCNANQSNSALFLPGVSYSGSGVKVMSLEVTNSEGEKNYKIDSLLIKRDTAPEFTFYYNCTGQQTSFIGSSVSDGAVVSWQWNFGDPGSGGDNVSTSQDSEHVFDVAGTYYVQLEVIDDCGVTSQITKPVIVNDKSVVDLSIQSPAEVCSFQQVLVSPETSLGLSLVSESNWTFGDGGSSFLQQPTHRYTTDGNFQIMLDAVVNGCKKTAQKIISVKPGNDITFSTEGICETLATTFSLESEGLPILSVLWSFGDGESTSIINPDHIYSAGDFLAEIEVTNSVNCVNTTSLPITIYSKPQTDFSIDLPPFSCAGSPSQFNDLTPPLTDSNVITWSWGFGDVANGSSAQKNPTYSYVLAGDYQVSLSTTTNFGCTSTVQKQVTISAAPPVNFTNGIACLNQGTQFTDASDNSVKDWLWSMQNSFYTAKNPTHIFTATGAQPVMLTVTGNNNCVSQITKTVNVPVPVVPDFTAINTCADKPTVFQEKNPEGNDPAVSWSWDFGGQGTGTGSPVEHIFPSAGSYSVKMNSTRQSGCVYSTTKSVAISQAPQAQFTPSTDSGGSPLTVGFTNTSSLATSYLWKFNDANNSTSNEFSPSFIFNQLGEYPVELIASNALGCQDSFTKMIQVVVPNINAALTEFKLAPSGGSMKATITIRNQGNISITNPEVIIDLSGNASVKEKLAGTILPNQSLTRTLSIDILSKNLKYACAELNIAGDSYLFDNRQCINLETETIAIQPYPNPAQDELFIDWINQGSESMRVVIYNAAGQVVFDKKYEPLLTGLNQIKLNVSNLGAGIYFVSYFDESVSRTSRFSIVR